MFVISFGQALLARISSSEHGAEAVLRSGLIPMLTECKFYTSRPSEQLIASEG